ncbi:MAG: hypothetical protein CM15mV24_0390 [Bellamyvirus sp.]|nr:MAG: hypothetical protein CM15mV24_0390 [Bellamyvirus sp.]
MDEINEFGGMTGAPISAEMLGFSGGGLDTVPAMLTPSQGFYGGGYVEKPQGFAGGGMSCWN